MTHALSVYLCENCVGTLTQNQAGEMAFTYSKQWLENPNAIPLSYSLPLEEKNYTNLECRGFFSGVLPEDENRRLVARILGISARNDFAMLERIGGECAGAVTFLPYGQTPEKTSHQYRAIPDSELASILHTLQRRPLLAGEKGVRLSLAGAQDKLSVMIQGNELFLPLENSPSSHILKPATDHFTGLVYNEALCLKLAHLIKIPAVTATIHTIDAIDYLLIERYDRTRDVDNQLHRHHQEDVCQALGIVSEMKYQSEGGPSLKQCFDLVRTISTQPVLDLQKLLDVVVFNYLIGNHDAHGKNLSILYLSDRTELAPLYDAVSTLYYPELSTKLAMKIGGTYHSHDVMPRNFEKLAAETGFSSPRVIERVITLTNSLIMALDKADSSRPIEEEIITLIDKRCQRVKLLFE